jgi:maltoporin
MPVAGATWYRPGEAGVGYYRWVTFGVRPVYYFNKYFSVATELGIENVGTPQGTGGWLRKLTVAGQIAPKPDFFSRPACKSNPGGNAKAAYRSRRPSQP